SIAPQPVGSRVDQVTDVSLAPVTVAANVNDCPCARDAIAGAIITTTPPPSGGLPPSVLWQAPTARHVATRRLLMRISTPADSKRRMRRGSPEVSIGYARGDGLRSAQADRGGVRRWPRGPARRAARSRAVCRARRPAGRERDRPLRRRSLSRGRVHG